MIHLCKFRRVRGLARPPFLGYQKLRQPVSAVVEEQHDIQIIMALFRCWPRVQRGEMARVSRGKSFTLPSVNKGRSIFLQIKAHLASLPDWIRCRSAQEIGKRLMKQLIFFTSWSSSSLGSLLLFCSGVSFFLRSAE